MSDVGYSICGITVIKRDRLDCPNPRRPILDDARTPISEEIERLKVEIARLSGELNKALSDAIYMPMSDTQREEYDAKLKEFKRLVEALAQLHRFQQQAN